MTFFNSDLRPQGPPSDGDTEVWDINRGQWSLTNLGTRLGAFVQAITPQQYGAVGDGVHDDTSAIQSAINAAIVANRSMFLPSGLYKITSTLTISGNLPNFYGEGAAEITGSSTTATNYNVPSVSPYIQGSIIYVTAAATDAIQLTSAANSTCFSKFGIRFADSIKFTNTGHGIFWNPPALNTYQDGGGQNFKVDSVKVYGHDGNHYAFKLVNPLYYTLDHLRSWGGGGLHVQQNSANIIYGDGTINEPYMACCANGTSHTCFLEVTAASGSEPMMGITMIRPEFYTVGISGVTAPTSAQLLLETSDAVQRCCIIAPDFETTVGSLAKYPWMLSAVVGGGEDFAFSGGGSYNPLTTAPATGTPYQNKTGSTVLYTTSWQFAMTTAGTQYYLVAQIASDSGMSQNVSTVWTWNANGTSSAQPWQETAIFSVPGGWYFQLTIGTGTHLQSNYVRIPAA